MQFSKSFQHTYEGLKQMRAETEMEYEPGFQHTYEGLKLIWNHPDKQIMAIVFSIPMRD